MSKRHKNFDDDHGYITFGWVATIVACLLYWPVTTSYNSNEQKRTEYANKCAEQYKEFTAPTANITPFSSDEKAQKPNSKKEEKPNWCDLAAQQSMAESTISIKWAAWVTVVFTTIG